MKPLSLTARISLLFAVAVSMVLLAAGMYLARAVEMHFVESDRHELEGKLELIRHLLERARLPGDMDRLPGQLDDALVGHHGLAVAVMNGGGAVWYITSGSGIHQDLLDARTCGDGPLELACLPHGLWQWRVGDRDYRGRVVPMTTGDGEIHRVAVSLDIRHHEVFMARFRLTLALAMTLAALATAGLGWYATHRGLGALRQFSGLAAGISAERLTTRLPEAGIPPELRDLARSFNAMLARLDDSFRRLSEFSSDIAHELRTPISNLMTQTQVALSRAREPEAYQEVLQSSTEEYERLGRMIGDMLFLAKADNDQLTLSREAVDLEMEARALIEFHGIVAEEKGVGLRLEGAGLVSGDRLMLRRALSNLLSNGTRHCPVGGEVAIRVGGGPGETVIAVENPGAIPPDRLPRLFDRFYTGDPARQAGAGGVGLGLAIARSIVQVHGGTLTAHSEGGVTRFEIRLPTPA
ncbi:MAG: heavy metal sensor histidine kinase [Thiobacillus sp.]|nr:heavy metal sensor histidine kinase [Thiobacillus sp.]